jgi:hypothetical protein
MQDCPEHALADGPCRTCEPQAPDARLARAVAREQTIRREIAALRALADASPEWRPHFVKQAGVLEGELFDACMKVAVCEMVANGE